MYNKRIKRGIDLILSLMGLIILSPVFIILCIWIKLDSKGPILFKQKRVGINKSYFNILKFRTMYIDTPKDMPTHMLKDPEQFITKSGKFLRKTSLDELPQIINILKGEMSIIGPRPALWNQDDLIAERDKYHANDVKPGLTGWAQINGRDELEIPVKAKLDGEYVEQESLLMDIKCFLGTIGAVLVGDGVVEGGTGEMEKASQSKSPEKLNKEIMVGAGVVAGAGTVGLGILGTVVHKMKNRNKSKKKRNGFFKKLFFIAVFVETVATLVTNIKRKKKLNDNVIIEKDYKDNTNDDIKERKILITGANSYIGVSVENWLKDKSNKYHIDTLDMMDESWRNHDFSKYDVVYHVAGIAHADVGNVSDEIKNKYYAVNTELAIEVCKKAKEASVKHFIFMSSMIVYSGCKEIFITKETKPKAENFYGDSKLQADLAIQKLCDDKFKVCVIRPPMIYGKGSKGNYPMLAKLATKLPVFPIVKNRRSMLHIDNLCEFVRLMIDNEENGVFFPQNDEYTNTSDMVEMIAKVKGHRIIMIPGFNLIIKCILKMPGKIGTLTNKAFGDSMYDMNMSSYKKGNYRIRGLVESINVTEKKKLNNKVLFLVNHDVVIYNFRKELVERLLKEGYEVIVSSPYGERIDLLKEMGCKYEEVRLDRHGTNPLTEFKLLAYYKQLIRRVNPDMIFSYTIKPNLYGSIAASKYHIPIVVNITGLGTAVENPSIMQKLMILLYKYAFRNVQTVFVQNEENKQFFIDNKIAVNKLKLLPGSGVNLKQFYVLDYPSDEKIEFVFISRIMKEKGIDQYLEMAKYIKNKYPNTHFHICGFCEDEYESILKEYQNKGIITYHGLIMDIREILEYIHCTIHPTYYPEGLSNVLLESCASGRPVITTDRSGCREVVDNGVNGYTIPQQDSKALINAVENFLSLSNNEREEMGLAGRDKVKNEFDRKIVIDKYMEIVDGK